MTTYDFAVIGCGIVGLSAALQLLKRFPRATVLLLEKEAAPAQHQTGRNSGVIHSGIYYKTGSLKARFAKTGALSMVRFCEEYAIAHEVCGKLIVATNREEIPLLDNLFARGKANDVPVKRLSAEQAREIEPNVNCVGAISVQSTGITDYRKVCMEFLRQFEEHGGVVEFQRKVVRIQERPTTQLVESDGGDYEARFIVNCAGLYSDRLARAGGEEPEAQIVPFRGEYYEVSAEKRHLVRNLIYPVPNPEFPFLGVHFTRMIDGSVHAGPNAVLALSREGYTRSQFNFDDMSEMFGFAGFWKLASKHIDEGLKEMYRSISKPAFTRSLQRLIPAIRQEDLVPAASGIRAQAVNRDGQMLDDFVLIRGRNRLHVCNAPSPAATASIEIGNKIAKAVPSPNGKVSISLS